MSEAQTTTQDPSAEASPEHLRAIAKRQKGIILCILIHFVIYGLMIGTPSESSAAGSAPALSVFSMVLALAELGTTIAAIVLIIMLAARFYSTFLTVLLAILTLIPLINLIVLLRVNSRATKTLRANNIPVGFFGVDMSKLDSATADRPSG